MKQNVTDPKKEGVICAMEIEWKTTSNEPTLYALTLFRFHYIVIPPTLFGGAYVVPLSINGIVCLKVLLTFPVNDQIALLFLLREATLAQNLSVD